SHKISSLQLATVCVVSLTAHAGERDREHNKSKKDGTIIGAVLGGLIGAAAGGGADDIAIGAAVGGAAGRVVGDDIDDSKDRRDDRYDPYDRRDDRYGRRDDRYGRRGPRHDRRRREFYQCQESGRGRFRSFVVVETYRNRVIENYGPDFRACQRAAAYYNR
ncbi:MAG: YMGG-like glycine zipper-containing protein, partial [Bdellovibrionota bacterium]